MEPSQVARSVPVSAPTESEFALLDAAPIATCVYTPEGHCVYANVAWERLWSLPRAVALRYNILEDPVILAQGALPLVRRAFAGESVQLPIAEYDPAQHGLKAKPRSLRTHLAPYVSSRGNKYVVARIEDVTDGLSEQRTHAAVLDALAQMNIGIVLAEGGRITWANDAYERITGFCLAELTSPEFDGLSLFPSETSAARERRMLERTAGLRVEERRERELRRKDGAHILVELHTRTVARGPPPRTITLVRVLPPR